jgi:hypothetical protein
VSVDKLFADSQCAGVVWRKCKKKDEEKEWKEDLRGAMFLVNHNVEKLSTIFCIMRFMFF